MNRNHKIIKSTLFALSLLGTGMVMALPYDVCADMSSCEAKANTGNLQAEYNLGVIYDEGIGVKTDYAKAAQWFQKASDQGLAAAQYRLGILYYNGEGVPQDKKMAASLYQKASDQDFAYAQYELGYMYQKGDGVPQNYQKALEFYQKAAASGDDAAWVNLGIMYRHGYGVAPDPNQSVIYYQKAVGAGNVNGAYNLGILYYYGGKNFPQDLVKSYAWFATADAMQPNDTDTLQMKNETYGLLPPADKAKAKTLAQQYIAKYAPGQ